MDERGLTLQEKAEEFFALFPKVITWGMTSPEFLLVTTLGKNGAFSDEGRLIIDKGEIVGFESFNKRTTLTRPKESIPKDLLAAQIRAMLKDSEQVARYCEQVGYTLLEEQTCIFNAPYGLHMKPKVFEERWAGPEWMAAWEDALAKEFHAKEVKADEKAGIGCFKLQAI